MDNLPKTPPRVSARNRRRASRKRAALWTRRLAKQRRLSPTQEAAYLLMYLRHRPILTVDATRLLGRPARSLLRNRKLWRSLGVVLKQTPAYTGEQRHIEWSLPT